MAKFRYIGDPNTRDKSGRGEGPDEIEWLGHTFGRKDWTEVTDPEQIRRLSGHAHYESADHPAKAPAHAPPMPTHATAHPHK